MIELFAGTDGIPRERRRKRIRGGPLSAEQIGPSAIHADAFDTPNTYQLQADIITAVALIGNIHQAPCRGGQIGAMASHRADFSRRDRIMQAI